MANHIAKDCRNSVLCFYCNEFGHRSIQCPQRPENRRKKGKKPATIVGISGSAVRNPDNVMHVSEVDSNKSLSVVLDNSDFLGRAYKRSRRCVIITLVRGEFTIKEIADLLTHNFGNHNWKIKKFFNEFKVLIPYIQSCFGGCHAKTDSISGKVYQS